MFKRLRAAGSPERIWFPMFFPDDRSASLASLRVCHLLPSPLSTYSFLDVLGCMDIYERMDEVAISKATTFLNLLVEDMASDDEIAGCDWFEPSEGPPMVEHRMRYYLFGGLSERVLWREHNKDCSDAVAYLSGDLEMLYRRFSAETFQDDIFKEPMKCSLRDFVFELDAMLKSIEQTKVHPSNE